MAPGQADDTAKGTVGATDSTTATTTGTAAGDAPAGTLPPADDVYVTGGTHWESFSLPELIAMVADKASVPQLVRLADDWRAAGNEVVDASDILGGALDELMRYWSGAAAEQARSDVALNAQWVSDLGETAYRIGDPVQEAAGALQAAQDAMPELPPTPAVPPALAADSAALAQLTGGPLAAAVSGTASGTESAFTAEKQQADLKAVAVEAMRRFEGAAIGIDQTTPQFEERDTTLRPRTSVVDGLVPLAPTTPPPVAPPTDPVARWNDLTGGETGTSAAAYNDTRTPATTGADRTPVHSGGGGVPFGGSLGAVGVPDGDGPAGPRAPVAPSPGVGATEAVPPGGFRNGGVVGAPAAANLGSGAHAATGGMGGMPMGGGMAGGQAGGEEEHRRRYPFGDDDSFLLNDKKASPPVIGL